MIFEMRIAERNPHRFGRIILGKVISVNLHKGTSGVTWKDTVIKKKSLLAGIFKLKSHMLYCIQISEFLGTYFFLSLT